MKFIRRFLNIVPRPVQFWAVVAVGCTVLIGLGAGYAMPESQGVLLTMLTYGSAALVFGLLIGLWVLFLGFVFADARRREMRAILWVLVAALFPHLLGFLLYFVLRQPIAATCTHCGMTVPSHQRFCSWCGTAHVPPGAASEPFTANPSQGASQ